MAHELWLIEGRKAVDATTSPGFKVSPYRLPRDSPTTISESQRLLGYFSKAFADTTQQKADFVLLSWRSHGLWRRKTQNEHARGTLTAPSPCQLSNHESACFSVFFWGYISETFADTAHHKPALVLHSFKNADVWGAGIRASCLPPLPRCPRAPRAI